MQRCMSLFPTSELSNHSRVLARGLRQGDKGFFKLLADGIVI